MRRQFALTSRTINIVFLNTREKKYHFIRPLEAKMSEFVSSYILTEEDLLQEQKNSNLILRISCYLSVKGKMQSIEMRIPKQDTIKGL